MEQRCTCGAALPDDARFCHRCGKPQYEEDIARLAEQEPPSRPVSLLVEPAVLSSPGRISFKNSRAVATSIVAAVLAFFGFFVVASTFYPLWPMILLAAGFFAVFAYNRHSREPISIAAGARLGMMTGLWFFLAVAIIATFASVTLDTSTGVQAWRQMQGMPQLAQLKIDDPHQMQRIILVSMFIGFFVFTLLPGLGGILGARFWTNRRHSQ